MWKRAVRVFEGEELAFIWPLRNGGFLAGTISNDHQGRGLNTAVVNKDGIVIRHRNASKDLTAKSWRSRLIMAIQASGYLAKGARKQGGNYSRAS
jgi:hypothetical protein